MADGRRRKPPPTLDALRARVADQLGRLPAPLRSLTEQADSPVAISERLTSLTAEVDRAFP